MRGSDLTTTTIITSWIEPLTTYMQTRSVRSGDDGSGSQTQKPRYLTPDQLRIFLGMLCYWVLLGLLDLFGLLDQLYCAVGFCLVCCGVGFCWICWVLLGPLDLLCCWVLLGLLCCWVLLGLLCCWVLLG